MIYETNKPLGAHHHDVKTWKQRRTKTKNVNMENRLGYLLVFAWVLEVDCVAAVLTVEENPRTCEAKVVDV